MLTRVVSEVLTRIQSTDKLCVVNGHNEEENPFHYVDELVELLLAFALIEQGLDALELRGAKPFGSYLLGWQPVGQHL